MACKVTPEIPKEAYYVFIREHPEENIGIGGCSLPEYLVNLQNKR